MRGASEFEPLAEIEVDTVEPDAQGFTLTGEGRDGAQYQLGVHFDMPLDGRTRSVLGELLSQSELTISRRALAGRRAGHATVPALRGRRERSPRG